MADFVVGLVKDRLASFLKDEASLLKDVHQEVEEIKQELMSIQSFLKDADKRAESEEDVSDGVRAWVQELREVAFVVEDVVTEYKHYVAQQQHSGPQGIQKFVRETVSSIFSLKGRHDLASQIHDIKRKLTGIHQRSERYGFRNSIQQESSSSTFVGNVHRRAYPFIEEDQLVGIETARDDLMGRLVYGSSQLTVIAMVGEGGSGKTTLARQVYDRVQQQFCCHAWLVAPEPYSREELLGSLTRELFESCQASVPKDIDRMDVQTLTQNLRQFLRKKRYFVIFDDIWKEDFWSDVESALIDYETGGRILITTRKTQVADFCRRAPCVHTHKMSPLPLEKAWELFCKKAFRPAGHCPRELNNLSVKIVDGCGRSPLAVLAVAGILFTKEKTVKEWERFHSCLNIELESDPELKSVIKIMSLSYNDLPYNLKSCFLYFGMFPRYFKLRNGRLIRQWIAEGFVKPEEGKTLEEVAQTYMNELINRSLVEALFLDVTGRVKICRVHDLLHEIILKKNKDIRFFQVLWGRSGSSLQGITRRLSLFNASNHSLEGIKSPHTHSVVVFTRNEKFMMPAFSTSFKFLKVLDFEDARLYSLPEDIGNLFDLRYLSVRRTEVKMLPKSIEKLENLETLDLKESLVREIPVHIINKLCKLRSLFAENYERNEQSKIDQLPGITGVKVAGGIGHLKSLQKLYNVDADENAVLFEELRNLTQLKKLGITKLSSKDGSALCGCLEQMTLLETLFVSSTNEMIDLEFMSSPPRLLRHLVLNGPLRKLPEWTTQLENLVKIRLKFSRLEDDALQVLKNMHNLLELVLSSDAFVGEHLQLNVGEFPKLKKLYVSSMSRLCSIAIEDRALPMLKRLRIGPCPEMNEFPSGLQHLRNLESVIFLNLPIEFKTKHLQTLQHVPDVRINSFGKEGPTRIIHRVEYPHAKVAVTYESDLQGQLVSVKRARTTSSGGTGEDHQAIEGATTSSNATTSAASTNQK